MRNVAISLLTLALVPLGGCMTLHADLPEEAVRHHMAVEEGIELAAICSHRGESFSEGANVCMTERRMTCDASGRWEQDGAC